MELKTKYQYTDFIYPYVVKESKYAKYLLKLLKDESCKLRIFRKDIWKNNFIFVYKFFIRNYFFINIS